MPLSRGLSELEGCILGIVASSGTATAYAIRRVFDSSLSPHWSSSAGSVYPAVQRLQRHRLILSTDVVNGRKRSKQYRLSAAGSRALSAWIRSMSWEVTAVPVDPLRTRVGFLSVLQPNERRKVIAAAIEAIEPHRQAFEADCLARSGAADRTDYFFSRGALLAMQARIQWLEEVNREFGASPSKRRAASRKPARTPPACRVKPPAKRR
jgi:DNA-binding PadR family transcriptional regulator